MAFRLIYIQAFLSVKYSQIAQKQYVKKVRSELPRGSILDRNGAILATTLESHSVFLRPKEFQRTPESLQFLRNTLEVSHEELSGKLSGRSGFVWLKRKVTPAKAELIAARNLKGVGIVSEQKRYYPNDSLACHVLGTVGLDNHGLSGIEQNLDSYLSGKPFVMDQLRDGKGRNISGSVLQKALSPENLDKEPTNSITLTLDRALQHIAEKEIRQGVEENRAERGMILIQNPRTGEILAMASYPSFDPNSFSKGMGSQKGLQIQNPMIGKMFEPGSTFKVVTFSAALEENKLSPGEMINCEEGKWKQNGVTINDHEPEGVISAMEVMEKSSNIGTAKIGIRVGKDAMYQYSRAFGFGTRSGIPMPGETDGLLREPSRWSKASLPSVSFGQEVGVSAIQLINAFSAIANEGILMEPQIIKELEEARDGKLYKTTFEPRIVRQAVSRETAKVMRNILKSVVERGTGMMARIEGYSIAGKTGTAQKIDPATKRYSTSNYTSSFCGFVPAENPQITCLVILDNPKRDYWGGSTAAPIFSRVVARAVNILGIPPQAPKPLTLARGQ